MPTATATKKAAPTPELVAVMIPLASLIPAEDNPRGIVTLDDDPELQELANSIEQLGILQALSVEAHPFEDGSYRIKAGHRRYAAANLAGLRAVPCIVDTSDEAHRQATFFAENFHRKGLGPVAQAKALKQLADAGVSQRDIGKKVGVHQGTVSKLLSLLKLPEVAQGWVETGEVTQDMALTLASLPASDIRDLTASGVPADWRVDQARRAAEHKKKHDAAVEKATKEGVVVLDDQPAVWSQEKIDPGAGPDPIVLNGRNGTLSHVDPKEHASEECHAVFVTLDGTVVSCCVNPGLHPAPKAPSSTITVRDISPSTLAAEAAMESLDATIKRALTTGADGNDVLAFVAAALFCDDDPWGTARQAVELVKLPEATSEPLVDLAVLAAEDPALALTAFAMRSYGGDLYALVSDVADGTPFEVVEIEQGPSVANARRLLDFLRVVVPDDGIAHLEDFVADFAQADREDTEGDTDEDTSGDKTAADSAGCQSSASSDAEKSEDQADVDQASQPASDDEIPTVTVFMKGKAGTPKWLRECSMCGPLSGFNTQEVQAKERAQQHIDEEHPAA